MIFDSFQNDRTTDGNLQSDRVMGETMFDIIIENMLSILNKNMSDILWLMAFIR